jgi:multiple sugar transport system permease protein
MAIAGLRQRSWAIAAGYAVVGLVCLVFFLPFIFMLSNSLKSAGQIMLRPRDLFALPLHPENFLTIFARFNLPLYFLNTFVVVAGCIAGTVLSSTMAGYALARLNFRGREFVFMLTLSCMFMPLFLLIIPRFVIFKNAGILNTLLPLIVPSMFGSPFCIFLVRQFLRSIPMELSEAAVIDGCREWRIYRSIIMPLMAPIVATIIIFVTQWRWNEFIEPLIYTQSEKLFTITMGLYLVMGLGGEEVSLHLVMSFLIVSVLPIVAVFLAAQRYFIEGVSHTGLKA